MLEAQQTSLPPPPNEPLPPASVVYKQAHTILPATESGIGAPNRTEFTGDVRLVWGDVTLRANRLIYDATNGEIEGSGNILLTRGEETVRGSAITLFLSTGNFVVQNGVIVSPPVRIAGERVERVDGELRASRSKFTPDPNGNGELQLLAREIRFVDNSYTDLTDVKVYVYGQRLLTIPRYRLRQQIGRRRSDFVQIPVRFKVSRISGFALGLANTWDLAPNLTGDAQVFFPTKNGPQYTLTANYDLLRTSNNPAPYLRRRQRDSLFSALTIKPDSNPSPNAPSPLRRLLTIQPTPGPDAILDFNALITTSESVGRPLAEPPRYAILSTTYSGKEEIGIKRQGNLLVSRVPEARIEASVPLSSIGKGIEFETNDAAHRFLRVPRFAAIADLSVGAYHEDRLSIANPTLTNGVLPPDGVDSDRVGGKLGVNLLPLLVGNNLLFRAQFSYSQYRYDQGLTYRVPELGVAGSYIFNQRTMVGGAIYRRQPSGHTPFYFDQIDTRSEAQGMFQGSINSRITAALLLRYDLDQSRLFDYGVTIGIRGRSLEPRIGYRKLGGQFSLGFDLVGF